MTPRLRMALGAHLLLTIAATLGLVLPADRPPGGRLLAAAAALVTLGTLGGLLDGRRWAVAAEAGRLGALALLALLVSNAGTAGAGLGLVAVGSAIWVLRASGRGADRPAGWGGSSA